MLPARVLFASGSAQLDLDLAANGVVLDTLARELAERDGVCGIIFVGYASPVCDGDPEDASRLSFERALAVHTELVRRGFDPNMLGVRGVGDRQPLGHPRCDTETDPNRRVDIEVWFCPPRANPCGRATR